MRRVALTGGIATGKTHVRKQFESLGVPTLDADVLAREAVAPGTAALAEIVARFGATVLDSSGALDRRKLGSLVFSDLPARHDLEQIVHPRVREATERWFASIHGRHPYAIADIPLLYEVGRERDFDIVIVAACNPETQLRRIIERDGLNEAEARQRIAAQLPIEEKARRADHVITTDGSFDDTNTQVRRLHRKLVSVSG